MQKKHDDSASVQVLFDQMFALGVGSKGEPIMKECADSGDYKPSPLFQVDPMDAVKLLKDRLVCASESRKDNAAINSCLARLRQCENQLTSTNKSDGGVHLMSIEELSSLNKLVDDAHVALNANIVDDRSWGVNLPEELVMQDIIGGLRLADIEVEEKWMVRGKTYLKDCKKVPAGPPLFYLRGMQVIEQPHGSAAAPFNVAEQAWCGFPKDCDQYNEWFIHNYIVPGSTIVNVICFYTASREALEVINSISMTEYAETRALLAHNVHCAKSPVHSDKAWANSVYRFWGGTDDYRNRTFKLFPRVSKASWAIQAAVGTKPALIGNKKLELKYIRGANYLEVDIDLSSSTIATHILGMVRGVSKSMVVDLGVGIEGIQEDELPEAILCQARFDHVDLDGGAPIPAHMVAPAAAVGAGAGYGTGAGAAKAGGDACVATGTVFRGRAGSGSSISSVHGTHKHAAETPAQKIERALRESKQATNALAVVPVSALVPPSPASSPLKSKKGGSPRKH